MRSFSFDTCRPSVPLRLPLVAIVATLTSTGLATAQSAPLSAAADPAEQPTANLSTEPTDIVVTARKRGERALDVPIALTVLGGEALEHQGINGIEGLTRNIPDVFIQERGVLDTALSIRGVGGDPRNVGLESGVSVTIDGATAGRTNGYNTDLMQIAQVEVLRGPQGTLFGTNTIGGVVNITTEKPSDQTKIGGRIEYGNFSSLRAGASVSGPVTDNLFLGAVVQRWTRDGYIYNTYDRTLYNDVHRTGGRLQLVWKPNDSVNVYLTGDATRDHGNFLLVQPIPPYIGSAVGTPDRYTVAMDQPNTGVRKITGGAATIDYALGDYTLTSISALRSLLTNVYSDGDNSVKDVRHTGPFTDNSLFFTQELRLISPAAAPFRYVAGLYYLNEKVESTRYVYTNGSLANGGAITYADIRTNSYAAYVNADYDLTSRLSVNGGARYTRERKDGIYNQFEQNVPSLTFYFPNLVRTDSAASWTGSVKYKVDRDVSAYATVSRGFKSGGFNVDLAGDTRTTAQTLSFLPEKLTNYEAGIKTLLFDRRLSFNASIFRQEYRDRQVSQYVSTGGPLPTIFITNAGASRSTGEEVELSLFLARHLTINASASHIDAVYSSFNNATSAGASYTGHITEYTPEYTANLVIDHTIRISDHADFLYNAAARYSGDTYFDAANYPLNFQGGYWLFDARAGVRFTLPSGTKAGLYLWGKNLGNRNYLVLARQSAGINQGQYGDPRTFGLELNVNF